MGESHRGSAAASAQAVERPRDAPGPQVCIAGRGALKAPTAVERAADLVATLGQTVLSNGQSVSEALALGTGASLWDSSALLVALHQLPELLKGPGRPPQLTHTLRTRRWLGQLRETLVAARRSTRGCRAWPVDEPVALFLGFSPLYYRDVLRPVAIRLGARRSLASVNLGTDHRSLRAVPALAGEHRDTVRAHWSRETARRASELQERLASIRPLLTEERLTPALYHEAGSLAWVDFVPQLNRLFASHFPRLIQQVAVAEHLLTAHRPAVVVSPDGADQRCRLYLLMARSLGIPTLIVQQGFTTEGYADWRLFCADRVAVMGETSATALAAQQVPRDVMVLTGHPGFDRLAADQAATRRAMRAALHVSPDDALITFASQPYVPGAFASAAARRALLDDVVHAATALTSGVFVVKPHPSDDPGELRRLFKGARTARIVDRRVDMAQLVVASDVLVTFFSQSALQAMAAGTPVVTVTRPDSGIDPMYVESGATWVARSGEELARVVAKLTGPERRAIVAEREDARRRFVERWLHTFDGRAAERVADLVESIAEPARPRA